MKPDLTISSHVKNPDSDPAKRASSRMLAAFALLLLVPMPSIGTALAMVVPATEGTTIGQICYFAAKVWLVVFPAIWLTFVLKQRWSWSPPRHGGFGVAALLGAAISVFIVSAFFLIGEHIVDAQMIRDEAAANNIDAPVNFIVFGIAIFLFNSLMEEYVWRWFVFRQCETLVGGKAGVLLSALFFTLHHIIAIRAQFEWTATILASIGVFVGGAAWSWCYLRFRSIWPGYVSHLIVDVAIYLIGAWIIFG